MFPTLAYAIERRGQAWRKVSADAVAREATWLSEHEYWDRFGSWNLPPFPASFSLLDRPGRPPGGP
jgi:hypothetical protein